MSSAATAINSRPPALIWPQRHQPTPLPPKPLPNQAPIDREPLTSPRGFLLRRLSDASLRHGCTSRRRAGIRNPSRKRPFRELRVSSYPRPSAVRRHGRGGAEEALQGARRRWRGRGACDMGSAFVVLGAFYRPAIGELAAIAKAAVHIELPTMGVTIPLYHRAGVAALQPEVGPRGCRGGGEATRE